MRARVGAGGRCPLQATPRGTGEGEAGVAAGSSSSRRPDGPLLSACWLGCRGGWAWGGTGSGGFACGQQDPVKPLGLTPGQAGLCSEQR